MIVCAIVAAAIIIGLMVFPFSPAALNSVEWIITCVWLVIGLLILGLYGARQKDPTKSQA